jgi:protein TonB
MRNFILLAASCLVLVAPAAAQSAGDAPAVVPRRVNTVADAVRAIPVVVAPATTVRAAGTMPATNPGTWVRTEDYPAWAVRYDVSGRVGFTLQVGTDGRVTGCEVTRSSGVPELDSLACEKITERARFVPARNENGEPVPGSWATTVVWRIPDDGLNEAPQPGLLVVTMVIEADGTVSACEVERAEGQAAELPLDECGENRRFEPILDEKGNPQRTRVRVMMSLAHEALP